MMSETNNSPDGQQRQPTRSFYSQRRKTKWWYRLFVKDYLLKLLSIVMALVLFFVVREDKGQEVEVEIPVVLSNILENDVFVGEMPKVLKVRLRDRWSRLVRVLERKLDPYLVDLRGFHDQTVFFFDAKQIEEIVGLRGVSIQTIYPSDFVVRLETKLEKRVPVRPNLIGEVLDGYTILQDKVKVEPKEIRIFGARSAVKDINEILTYPVDLSSLEREAHVETKVQKPANRYLYLEEEKVVITVPIVPLHGRSVLENMEIVVEGCPQGYNCKVEPAMVKATLSGPKPVLLKVEKGTAAVRAVVDVDLNDLSGARSAKISVACERPEGLECRLSPSVVTLHISKTE
jgi:hypothetical protein